MKAWPASLNCFPRCLKAACKREYLGSQNEDLQGFWRIGVSGTASQGRRYDRLLSGCNSKYEMHIYGAAKGTIAWEAVCTSRTGVNNMIPDRSESILSQASQDDQITLAQSTTRYFYLLVQHRQISVERFPRSDPGSVGPFRSYRLSRQEYCGHRRIGNEKRLSLSRNF